VTSRPSLTLLAFGLITGCILAMQIVLSRLLASTITYYYAFMLISLAMLGLAAGGLLVQLRSATFSPARLGRQAGASSVALGLTAMAGTLAYLWIYRHVQLVGNEKFYANDYWALAGLFWCLFPPFLAGGLVVSLVLKHARERFHLFYGVDLVTAAFGCLIAIVLLDRQTPVESMLTVVSVIPLLAGALFLFADRRPTPAALVLLVCVIVLGIGHALIQMPAIATPAHLRFFKHPTILSAWNAQSSIRVHTGPFFTWSLSSTYAGPRFPMVDMLIDGIGGTQIVAFDGNPASLADYEYLDYDLNALGQKLVPVTGRQLIVGPGGGVDILQAVRRGRSDITAVEINPLVAQVVNGDLERSPAGPTTCPVCASSSRTAGPS